MTLPRITLVTPSYNQGRFIRATIESVLSQGYPNLEYIVVDNQSQDETPQILSEYRDQLRIICEPDRGQSDAINKGLRLGTGEILGYLNSDDILLPGALQHLATTYQHSPWDWLSGDCRLITESGQPSPHHWLVAGYKQFLSRLYSRQLLMIADSMFPQPSTFWSRRAWDKVGEFNTDYHYVMDYDYWLRLSRFYQPFFTHYTLSAFRSQANSKSETGRERLMAEGLLALARNGAGRPTLLLHRLHSFIVWQIYQLLT